MKNLFKENQDIKILPKEIEKASNGKIMSVDNNGIIIEIDSKNITNGEAEFFTVVEDGIIYFLSSTQTVGENTLKVPYPQQYKMLQRRKYSRLEYKKEIILTKDGKEIKAQASDISAGGMKLDAEIELKIDTDYTVALNIDKNKSITLTFSPIRTDLNKNGTYTVSGRFKMLSNLDRISLVQFCFKKQMENTNK